MVHLEATGHSSASPEAVWKLLADAKGWQTWSPMDETTLEEPGSPEPDGVGALRRFRTGRLVNRERVVAFEPNRRLAYTLVSGLPLKDYRAEFTLEPDGAGTKITWRSEFRGPIPGTGWIYAYFLRRFMRDFFPALAKAAEA
jgi:uncharacterized protein YndB with AHSA1/START domain